MRKNSIFVIAMLVFIALLSSREMANQPTSDLRALLNVSQPVFHTGSSADEKLLIHFKLINIGSSKTLNPRIESSKIIINGRELKGSGFILSNGPRDTRWQSLPPGKTLEFDYALEEYFRKPGIYRISWRGKNFEAPPIMFTVSAVAAAPRNVNLQTSPLSAKIVVPDNLSVIDGSAEGNLVLKNISPKPVRICTLYQEWRGVGGNTFSVKLSPEHWKSDAPSLEEIAKHCVNLPPSKQIALPFHLIEPKSETLRISAEYEIGASFAAKYQTWTGSISAEPLVVRVRR